MTNAASLPANLADLIVPAAVLIEGLFGYPDVVFRTIGHPVVWIGWLIETLDKNLNRDEWSASTRRIAGVAALAILLAVTMTIASFVQAFLLSSPAGAVGLAVLASTLIAGRSLQDHVRNVASALETNNLESGRREVAKIVGRDPQNLDQYAVARAAIESLAENFSDGVVAPVFWFAVLGFPGLAAYKAINTADSMIGHRTPRHEAFGWAAARLDDLVNLPASRLTGLLFAMAALFIPAASPREALRAMWRDAGRHRSPNAGWPESSMAGTLGVKLNGPRTYGGVPSDDAFMGCGTADATPSDIERSLRLAAVAWWLMLAAIIVVTFIARS